MSEYDMQKFAQELKILIFNCFWKNWPTVRLFVTDIKKVLDQFMSSLL